jgi:hypothetical protein
MTTRIVLTNENTFILCQNWPEEPYLDTEPGIWEYAERKNESLAAGLVISNPEVVIYTDYKRNIWSRHQVNTDPLKPGDYLPVPDSVGWRIEEVPEYPIDHTSYPPMNTVATLFLKSVEENKSSNLFDILDKLERVPYETDLQFKSRKQQTEINWLRSQLEEKDKLLLQETGKAMRYSQTIADLQSQLSKAKDKEIRGDRMIVNLEHKLTVEKTHNSRLVEALKEAELYLRQRVSEYDDLPGHVRPEHQREKIRLRNVYEEVKLALSPQPAPEPETGNVIEMEPQTPEFEEFWGKFKQHQKDKMKVSPPEPEEKKPNAQEAFEWLRNELKDSNFQDDGISEVFKGGITKEQAASFRNFGAASPGVNHQEDEPKKDCKCTGLWDCQCEDVINNYNDPDLFARFRDNMDTEQKKTLVNQSLETAGYALGLCYNVLALKSHIEGTVNIKGELFAISFKPSAAPSQVEEQESLKVVNAQLRHQLIQDSKQFKALQADNQQLKEELEREKSKNMPKSAFKTPPQTN